MVGYVTDAVVDSLRKWTKLTKEYIFPVYATDGVTEVTDTPIPCVAIHVNGDTGHDNTYIGGGVRLYFELQLLYIVPIMNTNFTPDNGKQSERLEISEEIINCMEQVTRLEKQPDLMSQVCIEHDLNLQFSRLETQTTYARKGTESVLCQVHSIVYKGDVRFDTKYDRDTDVVLKHVKADINNGEIKTVIP